MGVSVYYSGKLAEGKSVDELVSHVETLTDRINLRTKRPREFSDNGVFRFQIPQRVIDNPDAVHWAIPNRKRILRYAQEARLPTKGRSYEVLCRALNSTEFTQVGVYLWVHKQAEPLRFLFVEGNTELTDLRSDWLQGDRSAEPIRYVGFQRDSLATKTGYEHDPKAHQTTLDILKEVNGLFFDGKMNIKQDE